MGAAFDKEKLSQNDSQSKLSSTIQEGVHRCVEPERHYHILFLERQRREPSRLVHNCTFWNSLLRNGSSRKLRRRPKPRYRYQVY
jgi:hypothetical protein